MFFVVCETPGKVTVFWNLKRKAAVSQAVWVANILSKPCKVSVHSENEDMQRLRGIKVINYF